MPDDTEEKQPELGEDDLADVEAVAEEIEAEADDDNEDSDDDTEEDLPATGSRGWGDMYVAGLTNGLNAVIEEYGEPDSDPVDEALARDLHLAEAMDEWMQKRDRSEMEPEQELLIGTLVLAGSVLFTRTDLAGELASEVQR